jgi:anti-anti-sigma regulatory factor
MSTTIDPAAMATRPGASDIEAVTGPMPVLDLDGHLHVATRRGVTIVAVDGGLDDALARSLAPAIHTAAAGASAVILDLDRVTLLDRTALDVICDVVEGLPAVTARCVVAGRLSGRLVLERWGLPGRFTLFTSVADALQAREFDASGYGNGWDLDQ